MAPGVLAKGQELFNQTVIVLVKALADLFRATLDEVDGLLLSHIFPNFHLVPLRFIPLTLGYSNLLLRLDHIHGRLIAKRILAEC